MQPDPIRVEAIFSEALSQPAGQQRAAFLQGACMADAALRARVDELLAAHEKAGSFMDTAARPEFAAGADSSTAVLPSEKPGTVIGRYKLLQEIGEGGFGRVFMAEQTEPVVRKVALKIIKLGMDTRQVIARFEAERQALAMMDHPNIAKVLDAGATPEGGPFFVMELVRGEPITEYCDKNNLSVPERLELFSAVCNAVQHAHQKGIIHRDIKPTNVLVTIADGKPVPKVIDFGIAKATSARLTEKTLFTEFRHLIGTPAYMSPEQAEASGVDIDTRSDIYSLGVLLYELLTGTTPFDAKRLHSAAYAEIQRIIREEEPPKPSTRLGTLETLPNVAAQRHSEATKLRNTIQGDLDWIVMKCLEKDRTRRYETASALAEEIRRHLNDEPVVAGPPGAGYRVRKFVRRHRAGVLMAGGIAAALLLGVTIATWQAVRASRAEAVARTERNRAEQGFQKAREAVDEYLTTVSESTLLDVPGLQPLRQELLELALRYYEAFLEDNTDTQVTAAVAAAAYRVARIRAEIGDPPTAEAAYERALELYTELTEQNPDEVRFRCDLAICCNDYANFAQSTGRIDQALALHGRARDIREKLVEEHPEHARMQNELSKSLSNLADGHASKGQRDEAMSLYRRAQDMNESIVTQPPASLEMPTDIGARYNTMLNVRMDLAICTGQIGYLHSLAGQHEQALVNFRRAAGIFDQLAAAEPHNIEVASRRVAAWNQVAWELSISGEPEQALETYERSRDFAERLSAANPLLRGPQAAHAEAHRGMGNLLFQMNRVEEARVHYIKQRELLADLVEDPLASPWHFNSLAWFYASCPDTTLLDGHSALTFAQRAVSAEPQNGVFLNTLGAALYRNNAHQEAIGALTSGLRLRDGGNSYDFYFLAMAHHQLGSTAAAQEWYTRAAKWMDRHHSSNSELQCLRREAEELLGVNVQSDEDRVAAKSDP